MFGNAFVNGCTVWRGVRCVLRNGQGTRKSNQLSVQSVGAVSFVNASGVAAGAVAPGAATVSVVTPSNGTMLDGWFYHHAVMFDVDGDGARACVRACVCVRAVDTPTALAACCGFDLCHKYILYLCLYLCVRACVHVCLRAPSAFEFASIRACGAGLLSRTGHHVPAVRS